MKILICSDGTLATDGATRLGALLGPLTPAITLLGVAAGEDQERTLREALEREAELLRAQSLNPEVQIGLGEPVRQIVIETTKNPYDLVVVGLRQGVSHWRPRNTYEVIKSIAPPVLVAIGHCAKLKRILVCTGGKAFIEQALQFTGKMAGPIGASVTLLHVMAEPPAMYADLVRMEEDVDRLLQSHSELGMNLAEQKKDLEQLGVPTEVRIRHGIVLDEVFAELEEGDYDLIVTGSTRARGMLRHYIMGDLTRQILNHSTRSVLVARPGKLAGPRGIWRTIKRSFTSS